MGKNKKKLQKSNSQPITNVAKTNNYLYYCLAATIITFVIYLNSVNNDFIPNWDDSGYVLDYKPIQAINLENIKIVLTDYNQGNYHPLTTFTYMIEFFLVGKSPYLFHITNLFFHLSNVILVFFFIYLLSNKRKEVALIAAIIFGIHPMHVESVAWISERKDVMYTFFFLISLIYYLKYSDEEKNKSKNYIISVLAFLFSLLCKSAAVCLPLVLFVIDYLRKKEIRFSLLTGKIPFFLLALIFGIIAIFSQKDMGAIQNLTPIFTVTQRFFIVCYAFTVYIIKFFVPVNLTAFYTYPDIVEDMLPIEYYICPAFVLFVIALVYLSIKKTKIVLAGLAFFLFSILLVLQILPVGGAILAERYTYVPYIGIGYIIGMFYVYIKDNKIKYLPLLKILLIAYGIYFSISTWKRIDVWEKGDVLFIDALEKDPDLSLAINNIGLYYLKWEKNYNKAYYWYSKTISKDPKNYSAWVDRGVVLYNMNRVEESISDFTKALSFKQDKPEPWIGRANAYSTIKKFDLALHDYNKFFNIKSGEVQDYIWRGVAHYNLGKLDSALIDFEQALTMEGKRDEALYWVALVAYQKADYQKALDYFNQSLTIKEYSDAYSWRGLAKFNLKLVKESIDDYTKAIKMNSRDVAAYVNRSISYNVLGEKDKSYRDILKAKELGFPVELPQQ